MSRWLTYEQRCVGGKNSHSGILFTSPEIFQISFNIYLNILLKICNCDNCHSNPCLPIGLWTKADVARYVKKLKWNWLIVLLKDQNRELQMMKAAEKNWSLKPWSFLEQQADRWSSHVAIETEDNPTFETNPLHPKHEQMQKKYIKWLLKEISMISMICNVNIFHSFENFGAY